MMPSLESNLSGENDGPHTANRLGHGESGSADDRRRLVGSGYLNRDRAKPECQAVGLRPDAASLLPIFVTPDEPPHPEALLSSGRSASCAGGPGRRIELFNSSIRPT
jgi:hypothetical protein